MTGMFGAEEIVRASIAAVAIFLPSLGIACKKPTTLRGSFQVEILSDAIGYFYQFV